MAGSIVASQLDPWYNPEFFLLTTKNILNIVKFI